MLLHPELFHQVDIFTKLSAVIPKALFRAVMSYIRVVWPYMPADPSVNWYPETLLQLFLFPTDFKCNWAKIASLHIL